MLRNLRFTLRPIMLIGIKDKESSAKAYQGRKCEANR
jgi:hypothetical protein